MVDERVVKAFPEVVYQNLINRKVFSDDPEERKLAEEIIAMEIFILRSRMRSILFADKILEYLHVKQNKLESEIKNAPKEQKKEFVDKARKNKEYIAYFTEAKEEDRKELDKFFLETPNLTMNEVEYLKKAGFYDT